MSPDQPVTQAELDDALAPLVQRVEALDRTHAEDMAAVLDVLEGRGGKGRWCWATVTGQARQDLWEALRWWVGWYNARYGYGRAERLIPPCWPAHPIAVEELTAQMVAWHAAYGASRPTDGPRVFHTYLYPAIDRLHDPRIGGGFDRCTSTHHQVDNLAQPAPVTDQVFARYVKEDMDRLTPDGE